MLAPTAISPAGVRSTSPTTRIRLGVPIGEVLRKVAIALCCVCMWPAMAAELVGGLDTSLDESTKEYVASTIRADGHAGPIRFVRSEPWRFQSSPRELTLVEVVPAGTFDRNLGGQPYVVVGPKRWRVLVDVNAGEVFKACGFGLNQELDNLLQSLELTMDLNVARALAKDFLQVTSCADTEVLEDEHEVVAFVSAELSAVLANPDRIAELTNRCVEKWASAGANQSVVVSGSPVHYDVRLITGEPINLLGQQPLEITAVHAQVTSTGQVRVVDSETVAVCDEYRSVVVEELEVK